MNSVLIGGVAILLVATNWATWEFQEGRYAQRELERVSLEQELDAYVAGKAHNASSNFEKDRSRTSTVIQTVTQEVEKIVEKPIYRNVCFDDDGLRALGRAIEREAPASQPK